MTLQSNFEAFDFNLLESFAFFPNNFIILPSPLRPYNDQNQTPIWASDNIFVDISRAMVALNFLLLSLTVWQLCGFHTS